jgi:hypothetical protein
MTEADPRAEYRSIIDELVRECLEGQGTVLPLWVRRGNWPQEREINLMLARLSPEDRALIARMLSDAYWGAVHDALRVLNDNQVPPFDQSYEGTPYQDFVGRLSGEWAWPD